MNAWTLIALISLGLTPLPVSAVQVAPDPVTFTLSARGATAYYVSATAGGADVAPLNTDNAAWTLELGARYRIINQGGVFHPLELRGAEGVLLAQGELEGSFEGDADVAFVSDDEGVTLTLTPFLAAVLTSYRCTFHPPMTGPIEVSVEEALHGKGPALSA